MGIIKLQSTTELEGKLENLAFQLKQKIGLENLIKFLDQNDYLPIYIANYQKKIWQHIKEWVYNDILPAALQGFVYRFSHKHQSNKLRRLLRCTIFCKKKNQILDFQKGIRRFGSRQFMCQL